MEQKLDLILEKLTGVENQVEQINSRLSNLEKEQQLTNSRLESLEKEQQLTNSRLGNLEKEQQFIKQAVLETNHGVNSLKEDFKSLFEIIGEHEVSIRSIRRIIV